MRGHELKFHYLLRSALGAQLVSAPCGPDIFTASASPSFIVEFLFMMRSRAHYLWHSGTRWTITILTLYFPPRSVREY